MDCARCDVLKRSLEEREHSYETAKRNEEEAGKFMDDAEFDQAHRFVQNARMDCKAARIELENHQGTHRIITSAVESYWTP